MGNRPNKHNLPPNPTSTSTFRFLCCCEVIDDRLVTSSLAKFPNLPQGNCSFLHKSISISPTQQPAKFIHYAATQTHDCDELHPTSDMAEKKKPYVLICRTSLFVFPHLSNGLSRVVRFQGNISVSRRDTLFR